MHERIRKLRRTLDLTQKQFGERIGVKGNTIATYELGRSKPIDAVISLICREFKVNERWLRTGEGEMFAPDAVDALDALSAEYGLGRRERILVEKLLTLKPEAREAAIDYLIEVVNAINADEEREETPEERHERHKREARAEADELYEVILHEKMEQDNPDTTFGSNSFGGGVA